MSTHDGEAMTTAKAAERLGVSVQTIQKWVDAGVLPAWKTAGGHRRVPVAAVERMLGERSAATQAVDAAAAGGPSVLLVEDDADTRELLAFQLSRLLPGARIRAFADAFAALVDAGRERPDLIVTDLRLPGMDGAAMLRSLLAQPGATAMRAVIVTSCTPGELAGYGELPADARILHKPVRTADLRDVVQAWTWTA